MKSTAVLVFAVLLAATRPVFGAAPNGGMDAAWSPDGTLIAFSSGLPHGISNIWVMASDGANSTQLTFKGGHTPRWIPDTHTIVFTTFRNGREQVLAIDASAQPGTEKPLNILPPEAIGPIWSPDGKRVAYLMPSLNGRCRDLWVVDADGQNRKGISMNFFIRDYAWDPDGKNVVFVVGRAAGTSLWIADVEKKDVDIFYKGFCSTPVYSPDGKYIAIAVPSAKGEHKITYIDVNTGLDKRVMSENFDGAAIRWRPGGHGFLFTSEEKGDAGIWTVGLDGRNIRRITEKKIAAYGPCYSPDGKKIVFFATTEHSYGPDIYVADANGANPKRLTKTTDSQWSPTWAHNGAKIALASDAGDTGKLLVVDPKSGRTNSPGRLILGAPIRLKWCPTNSKLLMIQGSTVSYATSTASKPSEKKAAVLEGMADACWSADSKGYYFTDLGGGRAGISYLDIGSKTPKQLTTGSEKKTKEIKIEDENAKAHKNLGLAGPLEEIKPGLKEINDLYPRLSPDGKLIAFVRDNQVWTVDTNGREQRQISHLAAPAESETRADISSLAWSPDGKLLLFRRDVNNEQSGLAFQMWTVEADTGDARRIYEEKVETEYGVYAPGITYAPAFAPDGKSVVFTSTESGFPEVCSVDLEGQHRKALAPAPSTFPAISPNGTQLAYISLENNRERLKLVDLKSGKAIAAKLPK